MKGEHSVRLLCQVLHVSRRGYYRWCRQPTSARKRRDAELSAQIAAAYRKGRGAYGAPRIVKELRDQGTPISQRRCARLLRELGLQGRKRHCRKLRTTDSRHGKAVPANHLAERPKPTGPNQVWVTDITYLKTQEGWLYLAVILDLWSRRVVGWACAATLQAHLVLAALFRAIGERPPPPGLVHHSDRGSQYVDDEYRRVLREHQIEQSMSRAGNCYDNAFAESFFSSFKTESGLEEDLPATRRGGELASFDYIETFYNRTRRHSSLGYLSPVAFENQPSNKDIKAA
ncbi:MAG: IS3 family transposase [Opitutaceae bacterium]|nr:IS3 family transposase [Opitutaceae bacterium]